MLLSQSITLYQASYQRYMVPLGPLSLAAYLETQELPVDIFIHDDLDQIIKFKPDVVGFSSVSENFGEAISASAYLKNKIGSFNLLGGPHYTSLPQYLPSGFDAGVIGEGEIVLSNIIKAFLNKGISKESLEGIPGVVVQSEDGPKFNPPQEQIKDLDSLPSPNRRKWVKTLGVPHMMTTRGCVYHCFFCSEPQLNKSYRDRSAHKIADEVETILRDFPKAKHIRFYDDIFTINRKRVRELAIIFKERKIPQKISFSCFIHAKLIDDELLKLLHEMNFILLLFGADSGSPRVIKKIKPSSTLELNQLSIDRAHASGMRIGATFIIGTPQESPEDLKMTVDFLKKNKEKLSLVEINPAMVLPGTELWHFASQKGLLQPLEEFNWSLLRDPANLCDFDCNQYIYVAEQIPRPYFNRSIQNMKALADEIYQIHGTNKFLAENYLSDFQGMQFLDRA